MSDSEFDLIQDFFAGLDQGASVRLGIGDDAAALSLSEGHLLHISTDTAVEPSENRFQFKEHKFSASGLTAFTAFQLKITMTGTSSCYPPKIKDLRGIALAV